MTQKNTTIFLVLLSGACTGCCLIAPRAGAWIETQLEIEM